MAEESQSPDVLVLLLPYELKYFCTEMHYLASGDWTASTGERITVIEKPGPTETRHGWEIHLETPGDSLPRVASIEADERPGGNTVVYFFDGRLRNIPDSKYLVGPPLVELYQYIRQRALNWGRDVAQKLEPLTAVESPSEADATGETEQAPRVPKRQKDLQRWRLTWRYIRPEWNRYANYKDLCKWLKKMHPELVCSEDILRDIICAGEWGLLEISQ